MHKPSSNCAFLAVKQHLLMNSVICRAAIITSAEGQELSLRLETKLQHDQVGFAFVNTGQVQKM